MTRFTSARLSHVLTVSALLPHCATSLPSLSQAKEQDNSSWLSIALVAAKTSSTTEISQLRCQVQQQQTQLDSVQQHFDALCDAHEGAQNAAAADDACYGSSSSEQQQQQYEEEGGVPTWCCSGDVIAPELLQLKPQQQQQQLHRCISLDATVPQRDQEPVPLSPISEAPAAAAAAGVESDSSPPMGGVLAALDVGSTPIEGEEAAAQRAAFAAYLAAKWESGSDSRSSLAAATAAAGVQEQQQDEADEVEQVSSGGEAPSTIHMCVWWCVDRELSSCVQGGGETGMKVSL
jgi:hypothetical protein